MPSTQIRFFQSTSISVGMAFATSSLAMVAGMVNSTGPWVVLAIGIGILIVLGVAHSVGGLAKRFPSALGIRTYIKAAFGNATSLFFVFLYLSLIALIAGIESNMFASIMQYIFPELAAGLIIAVVFAIVLTINLFGYEFSKYAQLAMVMIMLTSVVALSLYGIMHADLSATFWNTGTAKQFSAVPGTVIAAFFLFVGFEWVVNAQTASRSAAAQLPLVLVTSVVLLGCVYVLFSIATVTNLDPAQWVGTNKPQMLLANKLWGVPGTWVMLIVSGLAVLTAFNAGILGASRLLYALAREGFLPRVLGTTALFSGAPVPAIITTTVVSLGSALAVYNIRDTYLLGNVAAVIICVCYCGLLASSLKLSRQDRLRYDRTWARNDGLVELGALILTALLLTALLFQDTTLRQAPIVLTTIGIMLLLAFFANSRATRNRTKAAATR